MTPGSFYARIGSVFGYSTEYGPQFHAGQDYPWPEGTLIPSPGSGRLVARGYTSEAGYYCAIIIGRAYFLFYHQQRPCQLPVGALVQYGDTIGVVGSTGDSTGGHVHVAVSNDPRPGYGTRQDPRPIIAALIASNGGSAAGGDYTLIEDDMTPEQSNKLDAVFSALFGPRNVTGTKAPLSWLNIDGDKQEAKYGLLPIVIENQVQIAQVRSQVAALSAPAAVDVAALARDLAALLPAPTGGADVAAIEAALAPYFAAVNANVDQIPVGYTPIKG